MMIRLLLLMVLTVGNIIAINRPNTRPAEYDRNAGAFVNNFASDPGSINWAVFQRENELLFIRDTGDGVYRYDNNGSNLGKIFDFTPFNDQGSFAIAVDSSNRIIVVGDPKLKRFSSIGVLDQDIEWDDFLETWQWDSGWGTGWQHAGGVCVSLDGRYAYISPFSYVGEGGETYLAIYRIDIDTGEINKRFITHQATMTAFTVSNRPFFEYHGMATHPITGHLFVLEQQRTFELFGPFSAEHERGAFYLSEYDTDGTLLNSSLVYQSATSHPFPGNFSWELSRGVAIDSTHFWFQIIPQEAPFTTRLLSVNLSSKVPDEVNSDFYPGNTNQLSDYLWIWRQFPLVGVSGVIAEAMMTG